MMASIKVYAFLFIFSQFSSRQIVLAKVQDNPCKNGFIKDEVECPEGYGEKYRQSLDKTCCVPCKNPCADPAYARMDHSKIPTKNGQCLGECTKCWDKKEPYQHYKNAAENTCVQCKDCEIFGLQFIRHCNETHNAVCSGDLPDHIAHHNNKEDNIKLHLQIQPFEQEDDEDSKEKTTQNSTKTVVLSSVSAICVVIILALAILIDRIKKGNLKIICQQELPDDIPTVAGNTAAIENGQALMANLWLPPATANPYEEIRETQHDAERGETAQDAPAQDSTRSGASTMNAQTNTITTQTADNSIEIEYENSRQCSVRSTVDNNHACWFKNGNKCKDCSENRN